MDKKEELNEELGEEEKEYQDDLKAGLYQPDAHPESEGEAARKSGMALGAVWAMVGAILLFLGIGWALDRYFQTSPLLLVAGVIFGTIVGFYQFYRLSSRMN